MRILLLISLVFLTACSLVPALDEVMTDKRTEYKKSESFPDLEVPPDLTAAGGSDMMAIPGEGKATLSEYQRQREGQDDPGAAGGRPANQQGFTPVAAQPASGNWVVVTGSTYEIWPRLKNFFAGKGYSLDLDDAELGVLGTNWSIPASEGGYTFRNKYKIFSEQGGDPGLLVLYISTEVQGQSSRDGSMQWVDQGNSLDMERLLAGELNLYFNGRQQAAEPVSTAAVDTTVMNTPVMDTAVRQQAQIMDGGNGNNLLSIPAEYTYAWRQVETALQRAGITIDRRDQDTGLYYITIMTETREKGWVSKLAFWKDDEPRGTPYQVSLIGVGDKTEVVVLNQDGSWISNPETDAILNQIRAEYNRL